MTLAHWTNNAGTVAPQTPELDPPKLVIPQGAGLRGERVVAVQIGVTFWKGKVVGATLNSVSGRLHRLEATRMVDVTEWVERGDVDLAFRRRIGRKVEDTEFRCEQRTSLVIRKLGFGQMSEETRRAWKDAVREIEAAIDWAQRECSKRKSNQYAVLLICEIADVHEVEPRDERYQPFTEASVTCIYAAEAVKLVDEETVRAQWEAQDDASREATARAEYEAQMGKVDDAEWEAIRVDLGFETEPVVPAQEQVEEPADEDDADLLTQRLRM